MGQVIGYKVAVCDDEKIFRDTLVKLLKEYNGSVKISAFTCGDLLLASDEVFDLIFLDIEMPGNDGMTTAQKLREKNVDAEIIFLTSHKEYVFSAFKVKAFRFLGKPVSVSKLKEALYDFETERLNTEKIVVKQKGIVNEIILNQVVYLEAFGDGTYIYDKYGQVYCSSLQMQEWQAQLEGKGFFRIHKSYMVSMRYVKKTEKEYVELFDLDIELKIARRNVGAFKDAYLSYIDYNAKSM